MTRNEIEALINLRQFSGETRVKCNHALRQLIGELDAAQNETKRLLGLVERARAIFDRALFMVENGGADIARKWMDDAK